MNLEPIKSAESAKPAPEPKESLWDQKLFIFSAGAAIVIGLTAAWAATKVPMRHDTPKASPEALAESALLPLPRPLGDFQLTERSGKTVSRADVQNQFLVMNFAFTSCSLTCLAVNERMAEIQRLVAASPDVRLVSLSVDPLTDTPSALTKFADRFKADPERWWFLTGEKAGLYNLIETSFLARSPELQGIVPGGFAHTDRIMLVDPHGTVCASFNGLKKDVAEKVVAEIARRRAELGKSD